MAYLIVHTPLSPPHRMELRGPTVVGRALGCELWMDDPKLSRKHCRIEPRGTGWAVVDIGSSNGTYVRGRKVRECILSDEDEVSVGQATIVFYAARYVSKRPADPLDAGSMSRPLTPEDANASENSTIVGEPSSKLRSLPTPRPKSQEQPRQWKEPDAALAFTRPPPRPIVREEEFTD